jgi:uncharacterized protein YbaA (DUF1428 family)
MARYVDGYVIPIQKRKVKDYLRMAKLGAKLWKEYGALEYYECVGDDLKAQWGMPFTRLARLKRGETVVFSFVVFRSRRHRDRVNARVMKDPRLNGPEMQKMPFDMKRFAYGGFETLISW